MSTSLQPSLVGTVDKHRVRPSRRPRRDGASSGRTKIFLEIEHPTVRPEEHPALVSVSKGVPARKSTVPTKERAGVRLMNVQRTSDSGLAGLGQDQRAGRTPGAGGDED